MDKLRLVERHGLPLSSHRCCSIIVSEYSFNLNTKVTPPKQTESSNVGMNTQSFQQTDKLQFGGREKRWELSCKAAISCKAQIQRLSRSSKCTSEQRFYYKIISLKKLLCGATDISVTLQQTWIAFNQNKLLFYTALSCA